MERKTLLLGIGSFFLALFLFMNSFSTLVFDVKFYNQQYEENGAYEQFGKNNTINATFNLYKFLKGDEDLSSFYNEKEKRHMNDVKELLDKERIWSYIFLGIGLVIVFYLYSLDPKHSYNTLKNVFFVTAGCMVAIVLLSFIVQFSFQSSFTQFHELLFDNNDWQLNPQTDNMILLFPQSFFISFLKQWMLKLFVSAISLVMVGYMINYFIKKGKLS